MYKKRFFKEENSISELVDVKLVDKLVDWLRANPFPRDDSGIHKFAEDNGIEADVVEQYVYAMLSLVLIGGKSKGKKVEISKENYDIGIQIEAEHVSYDTENKVLLRMQEILKEKVMSDHIEENSNYYIDGVPSFKDELKQEK